MAAKNFSQLLKHELKEHFPDLKFIHEFENGQAAMKQIPFLHESFQDQLLQAINQWNEPPVCPREIRQEKKVKPKPVLKWGASYTDSVPEALLVVDQVRTFTVFLDQTGSMTNVVGSTRPEDAASVVFKFLQLGYTINLIGFHVELTETAMSLKGDLQLGDLRILFRKCMTTWATDLNLIKAYLNGDSYITTGWPGKGKDYAENLDIKFIPIKDAHTKGSEVLVITDAEKNVINIEEMKNPVSVMVMWEEVTEKEKNMWEDIHKKWNITVTFRCLSRTKSFSVFSKQEETSYDNDHSGAVSAFINHVNSGIPRVTVVTEGVESVRPSGEDACELNERGQPVVTLFPGQRIYVVTFPEGTDLEKISKDLVIKHESGETENLPYQKQLSYDEVYVRNIRSLVYHANINENTSIKTDKVAKLVPKSSGVNPFRLLAHEGWRMREEPAYHVIFANLVKNKEYNDQLKEIKAYEEGNGAGKKEADQLKEIKAYEEGNGAGKKEAKREKRKNPTPDPVAVSIGQSRSLYKTRKKK